MKLVYAFLLCILLQACGGLDPGTLPTASMVVGTVRFVGGVSAWPDTLEEVRVVLFAEPPLAPDSVIAAILSNRAAFSDTLMRFTDSSTYQISISDPPKTYGYVVVAGRVGPNLLKDWIMLDLYSNHPTDWVPAQLSIPEGTQVTVDFDVDFLNPPPQPFE